MHIFNSMESDVLFPTIDAYDIHTAGGLALYSAHCDFYPLKSVIENNKKALHAVDAAYRKIVDIARDYGNFRTESWAITSGILLTSRVGVFIQYSLLLTMIALLEEAVNTLCRIHKIMEHFDKDLEDVRGSGLERAAKYLKDIVGIDGFKADQDWKYITTIRDCRNMAVDNGGHINDDVKPKCDKFDIGYQEDAQLYIEYSDIMKFYEAILDFMDRTFLLEPSNGSA